MTFLSGVGRQTAEQVVPADGDDGHRRCVGFEPACLARETVHRHMFAQLHT